MTGEEKKIIEIEVIRMANAVRKHASGLYRTIHPEPKPDWEEAIFTAGFMLLVSAEIAKDLERE